MDNTSDFEGFSAGGDGSTATSNAGPKKGKKRARMVAEESSMTQAFGSWLNDSKESMSNMANSMGYSKELSASRQKLYEELEKIDITKRQRFKAAALIMAVEERVDNFLFIKPADKEAWVIALLDGEIYPLT